MPRKANPEKEKKRRTVAKGVVAGKSTKTIARKAKCSARHVERLAKEPETQFLITEALRPQQTRLAKLATKVITAVDKALTAMKTDKVDHTSRLRAVERYGELLELAQGKPPAQDNQTSGESRQFTWEEFVVMYRRGKSNVQDDTSHTPTVG
jgi:hypothetical protein